MDFALILGVTKLRDKSSGNVSHAENRYHPDAGLIDIPSNYPLSSFSQAPPNLSGAWKNDS